MTQIAPDAPTARAQADLTAALTMANRWREVSGQSILSAWIRSQPGEANACLLARAFNHNCEVLYSLAYLNDYPTRSEWVCESCGETRTDFRGIKYAMRCSSGTVEFFDHGAAALFAETFGLDVIRESVVQLPDPIALVAYEFDNGAYPDLEEDLGA